VSEDRWTCWWTQCISYHAFSSRPLGVKIGGSLCWMPVWHVGCCLIRHRYKVSGWYSGMFLLLYTLDKITLVSEINSVACQLTSLLHHFVIRPALVG